MNDYKNLFAVQQLESIVGEKVDNLNDINLSDELIMVIKNVSSFGYKFDSDALKYLYTLNKIDLIKLYKDSIYPGLCNRLGKKEGFEVFYNNFPDEVVNKSHLELFINAIIHYITLGELYPESIKEDREEYTKYNKLKTISLLTEEKFNLIVKEYALMNKPYPNYIKNIIFNLIKEKGHFVNQKLPIKENISTYIELLKKANINEIPVLINWTDTPTDLLRIFNSTLNKKEKLPNIKRSIRRVVLNKLDELVTKKGISAVYEEVNKYSEMWKRFGEKLHPGDYSDKYENAYLIFSMVRKNVTIETWSNKLYSALKRKDINTALKLLVAKPGEFARKLQALYNIAIEAQTKNLQTVSDVNKITQVFLTIIDKISINVLLQLHNHFKYKIYDPYRYYISKRNSNMNVIGNEKIKQNIGDDKYKNVVQYLVDRIEEKIVLKLQNSDKEKLSIFSDENINLNSHNKTYLDENLKDIKLPENTRTLSEGMFLVGRGTKFDFDKDTKILRFFVHWKNITDINSQYRNRVDIDLSADVYTEDFKNKHAFNYYSDYYDGVNGMGVFSGDITNALHGASEFIDINIDTALNKGFRYIVTHVYSYTGQPFNVIPELCFGYMERKEPGQRGEIFDARTVSNKINLTGNKTRVIATLIDLKDKKVIFVDMANDTPKIYSQSYAYIKKDLKIYDVILNINPINVYDILKMYIESLNLNLVYENDIDDDTIVISKNNFDNKLMYEILTKVI